MVPLRRKLYLILMCGFICALLIFVFGIREGMQSSYLLGRPGLIKEALSSAQAPYDTGQRVVMPEDKEPPVKGNGFFSSIKGLPPAVEYAATAPSLAADSGRIQDSPLSFADSGLIQSSPPAVEPNQDSPLNIRREEILQLPLPPDTEPKISSGELLEQTMREINEELVSSSQNLNSSFINRSILGVWHDWKPILNRSDIFPESRSAMEEGLLFWRELIRSVLDDVKQENQRLAQLGAPSPMAYAPAASEPWKECPYSVSELNTSELRRDDFVLRVPCGLVVDSSITFVGIPHGFMGDFKVNLLGERLPGEQRPSIILHFNVRWHGDLLSNTSVIVQNSWTMAHDWQEEQRCPPVEEPKNVTTVDGLSKCLDEVGKPVAGREISGVKLPLTTSGRPSKTKPWFPFVEENPFAATLRVGVEGFHMTVNGKHITSYEYRQNLEPWLVSGVEAKGDLQLSSLMVNGLPYVEEVDRVTDLQFLKAPALPADANLSMLIGVFSTSNNFDRRMAIRRSWMQAKEVRSGKVAVRFFVGLHKTKQVNRELWNEAITYGDVQLMPFVDYYHLITLKTLAVCIHATKNLRPDFVMKTDDDTFVRVDEVLSRVTERKTLNSLLYGRMEFEAIPHRSPDDKWFVSEEEFANPKYPPWAHGPGYIISLNIANFVVQRHEKRQLQIFKLEDVAMGIWIEQFRNTTGSHVDYSNDDNFVHTGCIDGYVIAHYIAPREMLCMWEKLTHGNPTCCN